MFISSRLGANAQGFGNLNNRTSQTTPQKKLGFGKIKYEGALKNLRGRNPRLKLTDLMASEVGDNRQAVESTVKSVLDKARASKDTFVIGLDKNKGLEVQHLDPTGKQIIGFHSGPVKILGRLFGND